jgi:hypothetical protein
MAPPAASAPAPPAATEAALTARWAAFLSRQDVLAAAAAAADNPSTPLSAPQSGPLGPLPALLSAMGAWVAHAVAVRLNLRPERCACARVQVPRRRQLRLATLSTSFAR